MEGIYSDLQEDAEKVESHFAPAGQRSYLKCCKGVNVHARGKNTSEG